MRNSALFLCPDCGMNFAVYPCNDVEKQGEYINCNHCGMLVARKMNFIRFIDGNEIFKVYGGGVMLDYIHQMDILLTDTD